jgi:hypothetical protein
MELEKDTYIRADDNKRINKRSIAWVKKIEECLFVCTKTIGCHDIDTHKVCKNNNNETYKKLIKDLDFSD